MQPRFLWSKCPKESRAQNLKIPSRQVQKPGMDKGIKTDEKKEPNGFSERRKPEGQSPSRPKGTLEKNRCTDRRVPRWEASRSRAAKASYTGWLLGAVGPRRKCVLPREWNSKQGSQRPILISLHISSHT